MAIFNRDTTFYMPSNISWQDIFKKVYIIKENTKNIIILRGKMRSVWLCIADTLNYDSLFHNAIIKQLKHNYVDDLLCTFIDAQILGVKHE